MSFEVHDELKLNGNKLTGLPTPTTAETTAAANVQFVLDNAGGAPTATNVSFTPDEDTFPEGTDNVDVALKHLFTSANSGKQDVADSIGYDVTTTPYSGTFATLAGHIDVAKADLVDFLPKAEKTLDGNEKLDDLTELAKNVRVFKSTVKLRKAAGSTTEIQLKKESPLQDYPTLEKLVCTPFVRVNDPATTDIVAPFNNGDEKDFLTNDYVVFDGGFAKVKNNYTYTYTPALSSGAISEATIDASQFEEFKEINIGSTLTLVARPIPQILIAKDNIPLDTVLDITRIQMYKTTAVWFAVSFDGGLIWYGNQSGALGGWQTIDISDYADFSFKGTSTTLIIDVIDELRTLTGNTNTIKFAYLIFDFSYTNKSALDKLEMDVVIDGVFVPYSHTNPNATTNTYNYNASTGKITINHSANDAYLINYIDYPDYP
jgi:hypothetical protein